MGLNERLGRLAARHARVLVVEVPGQWRTRAAVERAAIARGWKLAVSPAEADVLAVCGEPAPRLAEAVELVWHQMPGPRVRVDVRRRDDVTASLDTAHAGLLDVAHHRDDAHRRPPAPDLMVDGQADDHGDMDHGDMDMSPGGIPLAEGAQDRDGLEMDVLHIRLGPVLAYWPAGLALDCTMQGDVVVDVRAELLDTESRLHVPPPASPERRIDNMAAFLALAGWDDAAAEARVVRDLLLDGGHAAMAATRTTRLVRRVRRSRMLRWSLRGIRPLSAEELRRHGLSADLAGDTYDRLLRMLNRAGSRPAADDGAGDRPSGRPAPVSDGHDYTPAPDHIGELVVGLDVATARLAVASLDLDELSSRHAEHGLPHA